MLGPATETYRGHKFIMVRIGLAAFYLLVLGLLSLQFHVVSARLTNTSLKVIALTALLSLAALVLALFWANSVRVTIHADGISYQSIFGDKEMRWDSLERIYCAASTLGISFHGVVSAPVTPYYHFKFVDSEGKKLSFGIATSGKLGSEVVKRSSPTLLKKVADRLNNGQEVDFGAIKVSRYGGVRVKKLFGTKNIPWNEVSGFAIQRGHFCVSRKGGKRTTGPSLRSTPNTYVLNELLNSIFKTTKAT